MTMPKRGKYKKKSTANIGPVSDSSNVTRKSSSPGPSVVLQNPANSNVPSPPAANPVAPVTLSNISNLVSSQISSHTSAIVETLKKLEGLLSKDEKVEDTRSASKSSTHRRHRHDSQPLSSRSSSASSVVGSSSESSTETSLSRNRRSKRRKRQNRKRHAQHHHKRRKHVSSSDSDNSESNVSENESAGLVEQLLRASGLRLQRKKGKKDFLPYLYVIRNDKKGSLQKGQATWYEHLSGIFRMLEDPALPQAWIPNIRKHLLDITEMATNWEWETVLMWSEKVFAMVNDGRLKQGWADRYEIKDIQRDIYAVGVRLNGSNTSKTEKRSDQNWSFREFNEETDGKPCVIWNKGEKCGSNTSHGALPNRMCHCCAWCANKFRKLNLHREFDCNNKRKFLLTKAEQQASTSKNSNNSQDFTA